MNIYGIIGRPLGHSFSKSYFEAKFATLALDDYSYHNFQLSEIGELSEILSKYPDLRGFSVTIPYKKEIIGLLDRISPEAEAIGAVNCVKIVGGKLHGYNTDVYGFGVGLRELVGTQRPKALVLGTGGASNAVCFELKKAGIEYLTVSRSKTDETITYDELTGEITENHKLIVNTTPLGTWPDTDSKPKIHYDHIGERHFLYDLVYNPPLTAFLAEGKKRGATILNGENMLRQQAEKCWEIWNEFRS